MALAKFKCTNCDQEFTAGEWYCASGEPHIVAEKTYYVRDAPADKRDCKHARLQMLNVIPERKETRGNDVVTIPGTHVEFVRGQYATADPQIQMNLDRRNNVFQGESGLKQWENDYFSDEEKQKLAQIALKGQITRLEQERNSLLAQVQEQKKQHRATA